MPRSASVSAPATQAGIHSDILDRYRARTPRVRAAMSRAAAVLPGGNTRTTTFFPPYPTVFQKGAGAWLHDLDGNRFVDLFYNGLSLIHGHAFPPVVAAMSRALESGTAWAGGSEAQFDFADLLLRRIRPGDLVRFTNTGSEAGMLAVSLARHVTGKPLILKFDRAYHGSYPDLEAGLYGRGGLPGRTLVVPFNDPDALEACLIANHAHVAAIIYEPIMYTGRVILPAPGYLRTMENLARRHGVLLDPRRLPHVSPSRRAGPASASA